MLISKKRSLAGNLAAATFVSANTFAAGASHAEPFKYFGVCEASAAAVIDETHFVVASDDLEFLTIYERGMSGLPTKPHPIPFHVTDIEGAARIGDTVFWLTSHSKNKPARRLLFATKIG